jgi:hypothetical protein
MAKEEDMEKRSRWIVFFTMVWLSACATTPRHIHDEDEVRRAAAVRTRWIGLTRTWHCPAPTTSGWTVRPLFPLKDLKEDLQRSALKAGLGRFCVYEYNGTDPSPELPPGVLRWLSDAETDKVAMTTSSSAFETMTQDAFEQRFLDQVQIPTALPGAGPRRVRLAFLDTEGTGDDIPRPGAFRRSSHGYTLMHIAGRLARGEGKGPCAVQIASRLTMPLVEFDPLRGIELKKDQISGGTRGTFDDLTTALWGEIVRWQGQPELLNGSRQHLVLNLSLGWDGERFGGWEKKPAEMAPAVLAVYKVLQFAADQDILVIAAAGNERPGLGSKERPLLPAGWESRRPLNKKGKWWKHHKPLVYAVSGVDGQLHPLVNTRAQGEAPRVAYADHVVVSDFYERGQPTATLTGTSVAAAVVSTAAALVWQYRPELNAAEVMHLLSQSGDILPRSPNFSAPSDRPAGPVRRILLCPALLQAVAPLGLSYESFGCYRPDRPYRYPTLKTQLSLLYPPGVINGPAQAQKVVFNREFPSLLDEPGINPQPGENPCPNCAVTGPPDRIGSLEILPDNRFAAFSLASFDSASSGKGSDPKPFRLLIETPSGWHGRILKQVTLEIFSFDGGGRKIPARTCPIEAFIPGQTLEVTGCFEGMAMGTPFQANLSFVLTEEGGPSFSVESPVFVEYQY